MEISKVSTGTWERNSLVIIAKDNSQADLVRFPDRGISDLFPWALWVLGAVHHCWSGIFRT